MCSFCQPGKFTLRSATLSCSLSDSSLSEFPAGNCSAVTCTSPAFWPLVLLLKRVYNWLLSYVRASPFVPFRIVMNDGKTYEVRHPDFIDVARDSAIFFYRKEPGSHQHYRLERFSLLLISRIEELEPAAPAQPGQPTQPPA